MSIKMQIFIGALVLVGVLLLIIRSRPDHFRFSRSITIAAQPVFVFAHVNDFHLWQAWSPWAKIDPNAKTNYSGPAAGVGAGFSWSGNSKIGEGSMTILESKPNERIGIDLKFVRPFPANHRAEFEFKPEGNQTHVTWSMSGKNNFFMKAFGLFCDSTRWPGRILRRG